MTDNSNSIGDDSTRTQVQNFCLRKGMTDWIDKTVKSLLLSSCANPVYREACAKHEAAIEGSFKDKHFLFHGRRQFILEGIRKLKDHQTTSMYNNLDSIRKLHDSRTLQKIIGGVTTNHVEITKWNKRKKGKV